jgi:LmbE family N-acetylglucosaminyl deacetylase
MIILAIAFMSFAAPADGETLLAIFAHPDDESTVSPILARYAREGVNVHIAITTDGRLGVREHAGIPAGDELATVRRAEMKCAAEHLGAKLTHFEYHDQLMAGDGYGGHIPHVRAMLKDISQLIESLQPDAIITWGPDGGSNHMDHRLVGDTVTGVFLGRDWGKPISLYYYGTPTSRIEDTESRLVRGVQDDYLNVAISYTAEDYEAADKSLHCHQSQYIGDEFDNMIGDESEYGTINLREFVAPKETRNSLFGTNP